MFSTHLPNVNKLLSATMANNPLKTTPKEVIAAALHVSLEPPVVKK
jgi:hypothetical protein